MGIGGVTSTSGMSGMQMTMAGSTDSKSKNIQNEITGVQQQMKKLSSKSDLSAAEKEDERKKLQKEISSLNTELEQHKEEFRKAQRREIMMAELQEGKEPAKEEKAENVSVRQEDSQETGAAGNKDNAAALKEETVRGGKSDIDAEKKQTEKADETKEDAGVKKETEDTDNNVDTGLSGRKMQAMVSADTSLKQAGGLGTVISRIRGGIAILKGEMDQDARYGADTGKKESALEDMEKREQRARSVQAAVLGEANSVMKSAANEEASEEKNSAQINTENSAFQLWEDDDQTLQQRFHVAL